MPNTALTKDIISKTLSTVGKDRKASACKLLVLFYDELADTKPLLARLQSQNDFLEMSMVAHKIAGGCAYFGTEHLHRQLIHFEHIARAGVKANVDELVPELFGSIDAVLLTREAVLAALE